MQAERGMEGGVLDTLNVVHHSSVKPGEPTPNLYVLLNKNRGSQVGITVDGMSKTNNVGIVEKETNAKTAKFVAAVLSLLGLCQKCQLRSQQALSMAKKHPERLIFCNLLEGGRAVPPHSVCLHWTNQLPPDRGGEEGTENPPGDFKGCEIAKRLLESQK